MKYKATIIAILLSLVTAAVSSGQNMADSLLIPSAVDSTLLGKDVLKIISSSSKAKGKISQSQEIKSAFERYVRGNSSRPLSGYRIRVFYDNQQNSRAKSEYIAKTIAAAYPGIGVYRSFESPNFKVSVGDFRSKDGALKIFNDLKPQYPAAFIVKENINYPR